MASRSELEEEIAAFAPENPEATVFDVFEKYDLEPPCFFTTVDDEATAKLMFDVVCSYYICMSVILASVNRAKASGDESAEKFAEVMDEHMAEVVQHDVKEVDMGWLEEAKAVSGYQLDEMEQRAVDLMVKWHPELNDLRGHSSIVTKAHLPTFVSGMMTIGTGDHYRPWHILGNMELEAVEAEALAEAMLEGIENNAHAWLLANMTIHQTLEAFLGLLTANPGKKLWTFCPESLVGQVFKGVRLADRNIAHNTISAHRHGTAFEMEVVPQSHDGNDANAITEALRQLAATVDANESGRLRGVMIMDDTGKVVSLEQFYTDRGEEVPQDVRDRFTKQSSDS